MPQHELTFGDTACEIHVNAGLGLFLAKLFVWESNGKALRAVGDQRSEPVEFASSTEDGALSRATSYLEQRFGAPGPKPERHKGTQSVRAILEPPLRDERPSPR